VKYKPIDVAAHALFSASLESIPPAQR
jgi:hypothetical protein